MWKIAKQTEKQVTCDKDQQNIHKNGLFKNINNLKYIQINYTSLIMSL